MNSNTEDNIETPKKPWGWLAAGLLFTIAIFFLAYFLLFNFLTNRPSDVAQQPQPTIIVLTAPPTPPISPTVESQIPTYVPTFTPIPTPDTAVAPAEIAAGYFVIVANTDGLGVTIRGGPGIRNVNLMVAEEGTYFMVLDGPVEADAFNWWQLELEDGSTGWAAADFLAPSAAP